MEITALILFLISSVLMYRLLCGYQLRYLYGDKRRVSPTSRVMVTGCVVFVVMALAFYGLALRGICSITYMAASLAISLLLSLIFYLRPFISLNGLGHEKSKAISSLHRLNCVCISFGLSTVLNIGVISLCKWVCPDVTTVICNAGEYCATQKYVLPFACSLSPTTSYVDNKTEDTLYRVVVSYAYLGEEIHNHYNVTDTIPPLSIGRIPCPPNYVARSILPVMLPSHGRFGRHRTRRSYIATGPELHRFQTDDFSCLGIKSNIRVDSFNLSSNPIVWEDPQRIHKLEQTINSIMLRHNRSHKRHSRRERRPG